MSTWHAFFSGHACPRKIACQHAKIACRHAFFSEHACQRKIACQHAAPFPDGDQLTIDVETGIVTKQIF